MYIQIGYCPLCGSPIYQPEKWAGTCPPSLYYVCHCEALIMRHNPNQQNVYGLELVEPLCQKEMGVVSD